MTYPDASGIIAHVDHLQHLTVAFREHSPTVRGQLAGIAMIAMPALTQPLPLGGASHATVQILAVIVGSLGALVVFGGLIQRVVLQTTATDEDPDGPAALDDVLLAVPHARTVWVGLNLLGLGFILGAAWCLWLVFSHGWHEHLAEVVMFALPAVALGWAAWRARVMWTRP